MQWYYNNNNNLFISNIKIHINLLSTYPILLAIDSNVYIRAQENKVFKYLRAYLNFVAVD